VKSEGKSVHANGLDIYYREAGQGQPLILLHGATDTHKLWDPFIPDLSQSYRVITPDSRGHGRTNNPQGNLSYSLMADDLAGFIQVLSLERPYIFGYSDGGQIALELGMRYADLPGALVIGGAWYRFSKEYQDSLSAAGFVGPGEINFQVYESFAPADWRERMKSDHPSPVENYPVILLKDLAELFWTPLNYKPEDFLKIITPTMILVGEKDEMVPVQESREMANLIPGAELGIIPGATHTRVITSDGAFLKLIKSFFSAVTSSTIS
jgi:pimeloyl-ACP methyl ester carboxylesterase